MIFLINAVVLIALAVFVIVSDRSISENKSYVVYAFLAALASFMQFTAGLSDSPRITYFAIQVGWAALFLPAVFFHFVINVLPEGRIPEGRIPEGPKEKTYLHACYIISFIFFIINFTPYFIKTLKKVNNACVIVPGVLFHGFSLYIVLIGIVVVWIITREMKQKSLSQRDRLSSLRIGVLCGGAILLLYIFDWLGSGQLLFSRYLVIPVFIWFAYVSLYHRSTTIVHIMREVLVAVTMTVIFLFIFVLLALVMESMLKSSIDYRLIYPVFLTGLVMAFFYAPLQRKVSREITKIIFRKRFESEKVSRDLSRQILSILKRDEIFNYILSTAGFLLNSQKLAIYALETPHDTYTLQAVTGMSSEKLQLISFSGKSFFIKHLLNIKRNFTWESIVADYRKIKIREELEPLKKEGLIYFMPFISQENILAVLIAGPKEGDVPFTDEDRELLSGLVANGTMAIENIQLMELNEKLKELDEMKRDFISNVTHELKSPLTAIQSCVEFLLKKRGGDLTRVQMDYLVMVQNNSVRLTRFISQLLDISRIEAARLDLYKEEISIPSLAQEIALLFGPYAEEKGVKIRVSSQPDIMEIMADQDKIKQVFTNLISNALKFTDQGEIIITVSDRPDSVEVKVADTGVGIPQDALDKLFDKFYQVKETHKMKKYGGTGLGLAIVKGIIDAHNGRISVSSALDKGTTFTFCLPKQVWE